MVRSITKFRMPETSRASSTKTRIETPACWQTWCPIPGIKSKFHENKDWNNTYLFFIYCEITHQEQVPRKQGLKLYLRKNSCVRYIILIKSKFHENKDWNIAIRFFRTAPNHQEQVPRKQGLKRFSWVGLGNNFQCIKSKFHENKDWNTRSAIVADKKASIKSKFHENKDWNQS